MARPDTLEAPKMTCRGKCGRSLSITKFYTVQSPIYKYNNSRLPICDKCVENIYDYYYSIYEDDYKCIERLCMMYDVIYNTKTADIVLRSGSPTNIFGRYISKLNLLKADNKTYNSNFEKLSEYKEIYDKYANSDDYTEDNQLDDALVKKWGKGFEAEDYNNLENHYLMLKSTNPNCNDNQEIFIRDLCFTKMQQLNAIKKGDTTAFKDLTKLYSDTFKQAGLRMTYDESANSDDCWGVFIERISQYTPEEYYKDKKLYKDFDGIGEYFKRFVLRPLKNLQHNQHERDPEFSVKDEPDE